MAFDINSTKFIAFELRRAFESNNLVHTIMQSFNIKTVDKHNINLKKTFFYLSCKAFLASPNSLVINLASLIILCNLVNASDRT